MDRKTIETERKFIIMKPDTDVMRTYPDYTVSEITQTYLSGAPGVTERVRRRRYADRVEYTHTSKVRISHASSIEDERTVTEDEYLKLLERMKPGTRPVVKTRHTLRRGELTYEIDVYPEWESSCIMECELRDEESNVPIPPFITVLREVTGIREYSNAAFATEFPKEEK